MTGTGWWIVVLPGEYVETSEAFGPFRSQDKAARVADDWNAQRGSDEDQAFVLPISPAGEIDRAL